MSPFKKKSNPTPHWAWGRLGGGLGAAKALSLLLLPAPLYIAPAAKAVALPANAKIVASIARIVRHNCFGWSSHTKYSRGRSPQPPTFSYPFISLPFSEGLSQFLGLPPAVDHCMIYQGAL